ncbi:MAG: entericidin EcnAB [Sulfurovum sp.]|nr:entericidin EcnAB [Sulfurovum sp.]
MFNMNKILLLAALTMFMTSGCSKTWSGVKHDSKKAWNSSKKAVHNATD